MSLKTNHFRYTLAVTLLGAGVLSTTPPMAWADEADAPARVKTGITAPIRDVMRRLASRRSANEALGAQGAQSMSSARVRVNAQGFMQVYVYATALNEPALRRLRNLEADIEAIDESGAVVQAWVPVERLEEIAELPFVLSVTPPSYRFTRSGSVTTQGDSILRSDRVRGLGVNGSGVRVGVISDGFAGLASAQFSGDLPSGVKTYGSCAPTSADLPNCRGGNRCNEGTAIAEIIHDIAPGADLAIAAVGTSVEFIQRLNDLVNDFGADVIIDDLGFFGQPYFENGSIARAVAGVPADVLYVSSAGNDADRHHEAQFRPAFEGVLEVHDFGLAAGGRSESSMPVTVRSGGYVLAFLQWNDRFGLSGNDYDLQLVNETGMPFLCDECVSEFPQIGAQNPIEVVCYHNDTALAVTGRLRVRRYSAAVRRLELFVLGRASVDAHNMPGGSVFGHPGLPNVLAVGAVDASDPGVDTIEPYSSHGPARIDFPSIRLANKPDIVAVDGVRVSGAAGFPSTFFGTSASAPHVAAIAALLRQRFSNISNERLREILLERSMDLGTPGSDQTYGSGLVDALSAYRSLVGPVLVPIISQVLD